MSVEPEPGIYRHFKGRSYRVYANATNSETGERYVFYQALYGAGEFYVRPVDMFMSDVDCEKYPEVRQKKRFELIGLLPGIAEIDSGGLSLRIQEDD